MTNSTRIRQKTFCINFLGFNLRLTRLFYQFQCGVMERYVTLHVAVNIREFGIERRHSHRVILNSEQVAPLVDGGGGGFTASSTYKQSDFPL